jgi:hypothetical protein
MKIRTKILLSSLVLLAGLCPQGCDTAGDFDRPDVDYFVKYYGTSLGNQTGVDMVVNSDGTITMVGISESGATSRTYFVKIDQLGNVLIEKYLSGPTDRVKDIEPYGNGEYLILSEYIGESTLSNDVKLLRVSADGTKIDSSVVGTIFDDPDDGPEQLNDYPKKIMVVNGTGKIIVSGYSDNIEDNSSPNADLGDFMVLAFEINPNLTQTSWNIRPSDFGGFTDLDVVAASVEAKTTDGSDVVCAIGYSSGTLASAGDRQLFYFAMDPTNGDYIDSGTVPNIPAGSDAEILDAFEVESINGGYFFVGNIRAGNGRSELFFGKLRESLSFEENDDIQFLDKMLPAGATNFSGISACKSNTAPEGYLVAGIDTKPTGSTDVLVIKIDLSGQVVWTSRFGSDQGVDMPGKITELSDGKVMLVGTTELGDNQTKLSLIKMNSSGQLLK